MGFIANSIRFQQCKHFENRLRFDKVTENLKVGTFFETQCSFVTGLFPTHVHTVAIT